MPRTADRDWINCAMSKYGKVSYISLPLYHTTKKMKGFAFVEFETTAGSDACLSAIGTKEFSHVNPFPKAGSKDIQRMQKQVGKAGEWGFHS